MLSSRRLLHIPFVTATKNERAETCSVGSSHRSDQSQFRVVLKWFHAADRDGDSLFGPKSLGEYLLRAQPLNACASSVGINIESPINLGETFEKKLLFEASVAANRAECEPLCPKTGLWLRSLHLTKTLFEVFATLQRACVIRSLRAVAQRRCRDRHFFGATALGSFQEKKEKHTIVE